MMREIPTIALFAVLLFALFHQVNPGISILTSLLIYLVSLLFVALLFLSKTRLEEFYFTRKSSHDLLASLNHILYFNTLGSSLLGNLKVVGQTSLSENIRVGFRKVANRIRLGEEFSAALASAFANELNYLTIKLLPAKSGPISQLSRAVFEYDQLQKENSSTSLDALQRSSTISMFLSTLLPSFILFLFIGSSILSQAAPNLIIFSLVLLFAVPLVYAINSLSFARRLIAETI
ncbi:MAG: hypothetical protein KGH53_00845 [Candidatus Micrarchaeota archaeon]|nr:hypothetical protein [Candidatus Micrarchaeota archaeon]